MKRRNLIDQAKRVEDGMNYQITIGDPENKKDFRRMMWWLPITGSAFRRVYHDPIDNKNKVRSVSLQDLIIPYGALSLQSVSHFTHRIHETDNDIKKLMRIKFYRDVDIGEADGDNSDDDNDPIQEIQDSVDGRDKPDITKKGCHVIMDVYAYYDLPEFEDKDEDGDSTGIGLPYVFSIHYKTGKVLAIRRNWKQSDSYKRRRVYFSQYNYQQGYGIYGSSAFHLVGSIQKATTGALRAFNGSLAFSYLPFGWKTEDTEVSGDYVMRPGEFVDVNMTVTDLDKALKLANFPSPSGLTIEYVQMLDQQAQTLVSTQQVMTGDFNPMNMPVGTVLSLTEEAQKVPSAQHHSLHESFSEELRILYDLNYDFLPEETIFYSHGSEGILRRSDFDDRIDVVPTSDKSIASTQMRLAKDQSALQVYQLFPQFFRDGGFQLAQRMMKNLGIANIEEIMYLPEEYQQITQQQQQNMPPPPEQILAEIENRKVDEKAQKDMAEINLKDKQIVLNAALKDKELDAKMGLPFQNAEFEHLINQLVANAMLRYQPQPAQQPVSPDALLEGRPEQMMLMNSQNNQVPEQPEPMQPEARPKQDGLLSNIMKAIRGIK
jgi:hypothetical protein